MKQLIHEQTNFTNHTKAQIYRIDFEELVIEIKDLNTHRIISTSYFKRSNSSNTLSYQDIARIHTLLNNTKQANTHINQSRYFYHDQFIDHYVDDYRHDNLWC